MHRNRLNQETLASRVLAFGKKLKELTEATFVSSLQFILPAEAVMLVTVMPRRMAVPLLLASIFGLLAFITVSSRHEEARHKDD